MTKRSNHIPLLAGGSLVLLILLLLSACSITARLPEGEQLYVGIGKTKIINQDHSKQGKEAIEAAKKEISVPPNDSFLGSARYRFPIHLGLWVYNSYQNDSTFLGKKIYKMFASEPILLNNVSPQIRSKLAQNVLREHGYFDAIVSDSIALEPKDSLQARVHYTIDMGVPYQLGSIQYLSDSAFVAKSHLDHAAISTLHKGDQFNLNKILEDREIVSSHLRNNGYFYYTPEALVYRIDTALAPQSIDMRIGFKDGLEPRSLVPWKIGKVTFDIGISPSSPVRDSTLIDSIKLRYNETRTTRLSVLGRRVFLRPGSIYSQLNEQNTRQALARLGAFSATDLSFSIADSNLHILNLHITSTPDKAWDATLEGAIRFKSNGFKGPGLRASVAKRNIFGGGEQLSASLYGSYENASKIGSLLHSYEFGSDLSLSAPSILFPGLSSLLLTFPTNSDITLSASIVNRARYFRMASLGASANYLFNPKEHHKHRFTALRLQYNFLSHRSEEFNRILAENTTLGLSLKSQFIPQIGYTYTYDDIIEDRGSHHVWLELFVSEAGNITNAIQSFGKKKYNETKKLLGVPYAQFVKLMGDLHYTYTINPNQTIATRFSTGAIFSYGNSSVAPYSEQFYVGGANSIRAFTVRSIGPGSYQPKNDKYSFIDQSGDFKLEMNMEWRFRLIKALQGAIFFDAGNIWLLNKDTNRPGGSLQELTSFKQFINQIALGSGFGIRYDLGYFVIRGDVGIGLHVPYNTGVSSYYNIPDFWKSVDFHLAIGYPF